MSLHLFLTLQGACRRCREVLMKNVGGKSCDECCGDLLHENLKKILGNEFSIYNIEIGTKMF